MKPIIIPIPVRLAAAALLLLFGCTYYVPAKLDASRMGDTLTVTLAGPGAARWDPPQDSLIIECAGCSEEAARQVEHFEDRNEAQYDIANSEGLTLVLYSMGHRDTTLIPGTVPETASMPKPRLLRYHYRTVTAPAETTAGSEAKPATEANAAAEAKAATEAKAAAAEKALKKNTFLKVTAAEGVAVYKDKTKREVLKILPQGSSILLLAREGDLYSVSVDGNEGFVDAEAVQVQE
ncbi:MAG TPA: hypothetical protein VFD13_03400 [Candidatus Kapabacteria bacterium]|nr:hypothetical protein [Candidatus Kapabacteria bacterium]